MKRRSLEFAALLGLGIALAAPAQAQTQPVTVAPPQIFTPRGPIAPTFGPSPQVSPVVPNLSPQRPLVSPGQLGFSVLRPQPVFTGGFRPLVVVNGVRPNVSPLRPNVTPLRIPILNRFPAPGIFNNRPVFFRPSAF